MHKTLAQCESNSIEVGSSHYYASSPYYLIALISILCSLAQKLERDEEKQEVMDGPIPSSPLVTG